MVGTSSFASIPSVSSLRVTPSSFFSSTMRRSRSSSAGPKRSILLFLFMLLAISTAAQTSGPVPTTGRPTKALKKGKATISKLVNMPLCASSFEDLADNCSILAFSVANVWPRWIGTEGQTLLRVILGDDYILPNVSDISIRLYPVGGTGTRKPPTKSTAFDDFSVTRVLSSLQEGSNYKHANMDETDIRLLQSANAAINSLANARMLDTGNNASTPSTIPANSDSSSKPYLEVKKVRFVPGITVNLDRDFLEFLTPPMPVGPYLLQVVAQDVAPLYANALVKVYAFSPESFLSISPALLTVPAGSSSTVRKTITIRTLPDIADVLYSAYSRYSAINNTLRVVLEEDGVNSSTDVRSDDEVPTRLLLEEHRPLLRSSDAASAPFVSSSSASTTSLYSTRFSIPVTGLFRDKISGGVRLQFRTPPNLSVTDGDTRTSKRVFKVRVSANNGAASYDTGFKLTLLLNTSSATSAAESDGSANGNIVQSDSDIVTVRIAFLYPNQSNSTYFVQAVERARQTVVQYFGDSTIIEVYPNAFSSKDPNVTRQLVEQLVSPVVDKQQQRPDEAKDEAAKKKVRLMIVAAGHEFATSLWDTCIDGMIPANVSIAIVGTGGKLPSDLTVGETRVLQEVPVDTKTRRHLRSEDRTLRTNFYPRDNSELALNETIAMCKDRIVQLDVLPYEAMYAAGMALASSLSPSSSASISDSASSLYARLSKRRLDDFTSPAVNTSSSPSGKTLGLIADFAGRDTIIMANAMAIGAKSVDNSISVKLVTVNTQRDAWVEMNAAKYLVEKEQIAGGVSLLTGGLEAVYQFVQKGKPIVGFGIAPRNSFLTNGINPELCLFGITFDLRNTFVSIVQQAVDGSFNGESTAFSVASATGRVVSSTAGLLNLMRRRSLSTQQEQEDSETLEEVVAERAPRLPAAAQSLVGTAMTGNSGVSVPPRIKRITLTLSDGVSTVSDVSTFAAVESLEQIRAAVNNATNNARHYQRIFCDYLITRFANGSAIKFPQAPELPPLDSDVNVNLNNETFQQQEVLDSRLLAPPGCLTDYQIGLSDVAGPDEASLSVFPFSPSASAVYSVPTTRPMTDAGQRKRRSLDDQGSVSGDQNIAPPLFLVEGVTFLGSYEAPERPSCPSGSALVIALSGSTSCQSTQSDSNSLSGKVWWIVLLCVLALVAIVTFAIWACFRSYYGNRKGMIVKHSGPPKSNPYFLVSDIQGSTALWQQVPTAMKEAQGQHDFLMRSLLSRYCGYEVTTEGDSFILVFHTISDAVAYAMAVQEELSKVDWPQEILDADECKTVYDSSNSILFRGLRVRMAIYQGSDDLVVGIHVTTLRTTYQGQSLLQAKSLCALSHGGQVITTKQRLHELEFSLEPQLSLPGVVDLGTHEVGGGGGFADGFVLHLVELTPLRFLEREFPPVPSRKALTLGMRQAPGYLDREEEVTFVFTFVEFLDELMVTMPNKEHVLMAILMYAEAARKYLRVFNGYECQENLGEFMLAFFNPEDALKWCCAVQEELMKIQWPEEFRGLAGFGTVAIQIDRDTSVLLFSGLRIQMGIDSGVPEAMCPHASTGCADYFGHIVNLTARLAKAGHGGQIVVGKRVVERLKENKLLERGHDGKTVGQNGAILVGTMTFESPKFEDTPSISTASTAFANSNYFSSPLAPAGAHTDRLGGTNGFPLGSGLMIPSALSEEVLSSSSSSCPTPSGVPHRSYHAGRTMDLLTEEVERESSTSTAPPPRHEVCLFRHASGYYLKGVEGPIELYTALPRSLELRVFPPLKVVEALSLPKPRQHRAASSTTASNSTSGRLAAIAAGAGGLSINTAHSPPPMSSSVASPAFPLSTARNQQRGPPDQQQQQRFLLDSLSRMGASTPSTTRAGDPETVLRNWRNLEDGSASARITPSDNRDSERSKALSDYHWNGSPLGEQAGQRSSSLSKDAPQQRQQSYLLALRRVFAGKAAAAAPGQQLAIINSGPSSRAASPQANPAAVMDSRGKYELNISPQEERTTQQHGESTAQIPPPLSVTTTPDRGLSAPPLVSPIRSFSDTLAVVEEMKILREEEVQRHLQQEAENSESTIPSGDNPSKDTKERKQIKDHMATMALLADPTTAVTAVGPTPVFHAAPAVTTGKLQAEPPLAVPVRVTEDVRGDGGWPFSQWRDEGRGLGGDLPIEDALKAEREARLLPPTRLRVHSVPLPAEQAEYARSLQTHNAAENGTNRKWMGWLAAKNRVKREERRRRKNRNWNRDSLPGEEIADEDLSNHPHWLKSLRYNKKNSLLNGETSDMNGYYDLDASPEAREQKLKYSAVGGIGRHNDATPLKGRHNEYGSSRNPADSLSEEEEKTGEVFHGHVMGGVIPSASPMEVDVVYENGSAGQRDDQLKHPYHNVSETIPTA